MSPTRHFPSFHRRGTPISSGSIPQAADFLLSEENVHTAVVFGLLTGDDDREVIDRLAAEGLGADYVTIDIAHGHADSVKDTIEHIKKKLPKAFVIAGNVATPEAVIDLENWGADATKVGVGPGKVCITKLKTGFGTGGWQLSALKWCARVATKPIIADGGIRHHGDIAKSVRFGAAMVMIGSLFAGHEESPGQTVEVDGKLYKEYYGSASDFNKGEYKHVEGKRILEPIKGKLADTLREMREDLQSSISYGGGVQVKHLLWIAVRDLGLSRVAGTVRSSFREFRIAPFYGCYMLRPSWELGFDDPENPSSLEKIIRAVGGEPVAYAGRTKCCGFPVILEKEAIAVAIVVGVAHQPARRALQQQRVVGGILCTALGLAVARGHTACGVHGRRDAGEGRADGDVLRAGLDDPGAADTGGGDGDQPLRQQPEQRKHKISFGQIDRCYRR